MPSFLASAPNGVTHDMAIDDAAHDGMEIDLLSSPDQDGSHRPSVASIPTVPNDLRTIMEKLTEIIRQTLGENHHTSTSEIDAPIDHGLLRGVLIELHAQDMKLPEDVGVVISAIQAYLHSGSIDHKNPLVC